METFHDVSRELVRLNEEIVNLNKNLLKLQENRYYGDRIGEKENNSRNSIKIHGKHSGEIGTNYHSHTTDSRIRTGEIGELRDTNKQKVQVFDNNSWNFDSSRVDRINNIADSFDVIRASEHNAYVIYKDNGNFTNNSKNAGTGLIKTLERNLDSNEYFKITYIKNNGDVKAKQALTKEQLIDFVKNSLTDDDGNQYLPGNEIQKHFSITESRPPILEMFKDWLKNNFYPPLFEKEIESRLGKLSDRYVMKTWLIKTMSNREDANVLYKAYKTLDKSGIKLDNFNVQRWISLRMYENPKATIKAIRALSDQHSIKSPKQFLEKIYNFSTNHNSRQTSLQRTHHQQNSPQQTWNNNGNSGSADKLRDEIIRCINRYTEQQPDHLKEKERQQEYERF